MKAKNKKKRLEQRQKDHFYILKNFNRYGHPQGWKVPGSLKKS